MTTNLQSSSCRCSVRVRPFTPSEAKICPEGCAAPRGILKWDGDSTLTVLDPQNDFEPRRNGIFPVGKVLWSFRSTEAPKATRSTQQDVYNEMVVPLIPAIVEGYNTAFCVAGASSSGRMYTLYGDDTEGAERGILPRFAEDIFQHFEASSHDNSFLSVELESVDVSGESYVDLLAVRRGKEEKELKIISTPEGPRLSGVTPVDINGTVDFQRVLKQLHRVASKRNSTHTVTIRFTETFEFEDPASYGQTVSKSRRVQVLFALLRNMPSPFQRCVDVAVEHDSGENPLAKVPVRETAFTKLFPDLLQQGYHLSIISCVSPYYEHLREDVNTLQFSVKVQYLKGRPTLHQDESLVEMRRLADEVKDLQVAAKKHSEAADVVQSELNAREVALMKQEALHNKVSNGIIESEKEIKLATISRNMEADRSNRVRKEISAELNKKRAEIKKFQSEQSSSDAALQSMMRDADDAKVRAEATEARVLKQKENTAVYERRLAEYEAEERAIADMEAFNIAPPGEQRDWIIKNSNEQKDSANEIKKVEKEIGSLEASDDTEKRAKAIQKDYDKAYVEAAPIREKKELLSEIAKYEKEIADAEAEMKRLQSEMDQKKAGCQCVLM